MNVCYVYQDQYPWDIRIEKIAAALAEDGMRVDIVSRNRTGVPCCEQVADRTYVHRVAQGFDPVSRTLLNVPAFFSPTWIRKTVSIVKEHHAGVILVRDLPLGPMALCAGWLTGTPVVMDMAENYPAMIQDTWRFRGPHPADYLFRNPLLLRLMERWLLPRLDGILVVSEPSAERVRAIAGHRVPIEIVRNTPRVAAFTARGTHSLVEQLRTRAGLTLLYVGGMEETRGLDTVIRALPDVVRRITDFLFVIVGDGSSAGRLKQLARQTGVAANVLFSGWVEPRLVPGVIAEADLCIVPHYVTEHTDTTIPNKLFDYMLHKKPVLVTQARALRRIVDGHGCGRVYCDKDPATLARAIVDLADPGTRRTLGEAGFAAVQSEYNWERDTSVLLAAIRAVAVRGASGARFRESREEAGAPGSLR